MLVPSLSWNVLIVNEMPESCLYSIFARLRPGSSQAPSSTSSCACRGRRWNRTAARRSHSQRLSRWSEARHWCLSLPGSRRAHLRRCSGVCPTRSPRLRTWESWILLRHPSAAVLLRSESLQSHICLHTRALSQLLPTGHYLKFRCPKTSQLPKMTLTLWLRHSPQN